MWLYSFLDYFFIVFHSLLVLFNLFGWVWKKTRLLHFITINLTAFSWFILGIWHGWGYCFLTDWHWHIRQALNNPIRDHSYTGFLIRELTGISLPTKIIDGLTLGGFLIAYGISLFFFLKSLTRKKHRNT